MKTLLNIFGHSVELNTTNNKKIIRDKTNIYLSLIAFLLVLLANALSTWDLFYTNILHILSEYNPRQFSSLLMAKQRNYLAKTFAF